MENQNNFLESCLFFNSNTLSRHLLKIAQKEFAQLNLSPAHASLMLLVYDTPGISPKQLSQMLHLTPSTITRFMDALVKKDMLIRETKGKQAFVFPSIKGLGLKAPIAEAYKRLYHAYTDLIGIRQAHQLTQTLIQVNDRLSMNLDQNG
jgi:DNA-binding MarR family transcriptional regulator